MKVAKLKELYEKYMEYSKHDKLGAVFCVKDWNGFIAGNIYYCAGGRHQAIWVVRVISEVKLDKDALVGTCIDAFPCDISPFIHLNSFTDAANFYEAVLRIEEEFAYFLQNHPDDEELFDFYGLGVNN